VVVKGGANLTPDLTYVNLDDATGKLSPTPQRGDTIHWVTQSGGSFSPVNGALDADLGVSGSSYYNSVTCAQVLALPLTTTPTPSADGEVFAVTTTSGHYRNVLEGLPAASPGPQLQWVTYAH
jgi:hypothetical protein